MASESVTPAGLSKVLGRQQPEFVLSGRIVDAQPGRWLVADAFAQVHIWDVPEARSGSLVSVEVRVDRHTDPAVLRFKRMLSSAPGTMAAGGQFQRFATRGIAQQLLARARFLEGIRDFFRARDFIEVQTPLRVAAPGTDVHITPTACDGGYLITSPEFHLKRLLVGGIPRLFEIARCFRGDEAGSWHQPEFHLLEWYRAFAEMEALILETEELVCACGARTQDGKLATPAGPIALTRPFERKTVGELMREFAGVQDASALAAEDDPRFFRLWVEHVEPALSAYPRPLFVVEFPIAHAALARAHPENDSVAERFELLIGGIELCNGYGELCDPQVQRARFESDVATRRARQLPPLPVDEGFLAALEEGLPPCAGNALGLDRLWALCSGAPMADGIAFPTRQ